MDVNVRRTRLLALASVLRIAFIWFFDDDDDETDREDPQIDLHYLEMRVHTMPSQQFKQNFRMDPNTFEHLLTQLHQVNLQNRGHPEISLEKSTLITIWYIGNMESFRGVAARFSVSKSTAWQALYRICKLLLEINRRHGFLKWPTIARSAEISNYFRRKYHIPGVIGLLDGSHIRIVAPKEYPASYINRKGYHSILLQGVCDHNKLFTDVYAGEVGSIHDYTMFLRSEVSNKGAESFPDDSHLIGDLAYKLTEKMLVGFKNNGRLTPREKNFNYVISKVRVKIENTFATLKGRFRRLKYMETVRPELTCLLVVAACLLHNLCILGGDLPDNIADINLEAERYNEMQNNPNNRLDIMVPNGENVRAQVKRRDIMNILHLNPRFRNNN